MQMDKRGYRLPQKPGDPLRVVRQFTVTGWKKPRIRLEPDSLGVFAQLEDVADPSPVLLDQMGIGAYDSPRFIAIFPEGAVYLDESDFQHGYVVRPMDVPNLLRKDTDDPDAVNRRKLQLVRQRLAAGGTKGDMDMDLRQAIQRVAAEHPETRQHLVPLLRKYAAGPDKSGRGWVQKGNPTRWVWTSPPNSGNQIDAFTVTEVDDPRIGKYYKFALMLTDGTQLEVKGQKTSPAVWFLRANQLYSEGAGAMLDFSRQPERWSRRASDTRQAKVK